LYALANEVPVVSCATETCLPKELEVFPPADFLPFLLLMARFRLGASAFETVRRPDTQNVKKGGKEEIFYPTFALTA
jgi:hypothetical protein